MMKSDAAPSGSHYAATPVPAPRSTAPAASDLAGAAGRSRSWSRRTLALLARDRAAVLGLALFITIVGAALLAPVISPHSPNKILMRNKLQGPSWTYPLGTDELGRDLLTRLIYGARVSMSVGVVSVAIAASAGIALGLVAAYAGGAIDTVIMRAMDGLLAFPALVLALDGSLGDPVEGRPEALPEFVVGHGRRLDR